MAENISELLQNVRTMEDIVYLLTILFTNLNNQNEIYYDMFLNPEPMELELERYDESGNLVTVTLPNRAKERITTLSGVGAPTIAAPIGSLYIDTASYSMYYKAYGDDSSGWFKLISSSTTYLTPTGDGSGLTNLNVENVTAGILKVINGGTGASSLTGLLKGNGTNAISSAVEDTDYISPATMVGVISYYPIYDSSLPNNGIPRGWLLCDGSIYQTAQYSRLGNLLKNKYGGNGTTTFAVPNLLDVYIKGSTSPNGLVVEGTVGSHTHEFSGITASEDSHTHGPGTLNATGSINTMGIGMDEKTTSKSGVFSTSSEGDNNAVQGGWDNHEGYFNGKLKFKLTGNWSSGSQTTAGTPHSHDFSGTTESNTASENVSNEVNHVDMVPIIKY